MNYIGIWNFAHIAQPCPPGLAVFSSLSNVSSASEVSECDVLTAKPAHKASKFWGKISYSKVGNKSEFYLLLLRATCKMFQILAQILPFH